MRIFYINKDEFLNKTARNELEKVSDGKVYKSENKYLEHLAGLFLTKYIAKNFYGIKDTTITLKGEKPVFKNGELCFSISHSKNLVVVAFSKDNIGVDVEYMSARNFKLLLERFDLHIQDPTKYDFYKFWTKYEAEIKLGNSSKSVFSSIIECDYMLTCVCETPLVSDFDLIKVVL